jgi:catechol 2,3-dioxygenase-like lactoylglutathione lyase family enzyme
LNSAKYSDRAISGDYVRVTVRRRAINAGGSHLPVKTRGLTHVALAVRDLDRTAAFYRRLVGAVEVYRDDGFLQMQTPGSWDVLVFEKRPSEAGRTGGILHFGFRLLRRDGLANADAAVRAAGGTVIEKGEFVPGEPYLFVKDPDGYTVELWYELPTKADPKRRK